MKATSLYLTEYPYILNKSLMMNRKFEKVEAIGLMKNAD